MNLNGDAKTFGDRLVQKKSKMAQREIEFDEMVVLQQQNVPTIVSGLIKATRGGIYFQHNDIPYEKRQRQRKREVDQMGDDAL